MCRLSILFDRGASRSSRRSRILTVAPSTVLTVKILTVQIFLDSLASQNQGRAFRDNMVPVGLVLLAVTTVTAQDWTSQTNPATSGLKGVSFPTVDQGWAVGRDGTIVTTANGGTDWTSQTSSTTAHLYGVSFPTADQGCAVGGIPSTIVTTANGGTTWTSQTSPTTQALNEVSFPPQESWMHLRNAGCTRGNSAGFIDAAPSALVRRSDVAIMSATI